MHGISMFVTAQASQAPVAGLHVIDWCIVVAYALGTLLLGWYFGRQQKSAREYFVGSGGMSSILIGVSLFATLLSTISYLSMPGEAIGKGPVWLVGLLGYPIIYVVAGYVLLPVYMKQRVTSAYELLEDRLGRGTRWLGAALFLVLRLVWMSTLIYFAATALAIIIGVDAKWEPLIVVVAGLVAVGYTSLGGLRAVVVTDFLQTVLLYGGALMVIGIVTYKMGGFVWFPTEWHSNWDEQPVFSLDPAVRVTMVSALLNLALWHIATLGGDQVSVQRFMATTDANGARKSLAVNLIVGAVVLTTLFLAGFALLAYYEAYPAELGDQLSLHGNADKIFPHFIATGLPPVISGLVVSALLAAAMSSVDSGINSITAVVMSDFFPAADDDEANQRRRFRRARLLALVVGGTVIATSSLVKYVPGNITAITGKTVNLLTIPIFCLFFFALFVKSPKPAAAWLGCVAGIIVALLIAFSGPIFGFPARTGADPVSFIWMAPVTLVTNIAVGLLACRLWPSDSRTARALQYAPAVIAVLFGVTLLTVWRPSMHIRLGAEDRARCLAVLDVTSPSLAAAGPAEARTQDLTSRDPVIRASAAAAVGKQRTVSLAPKLLELLDDPDPSVRTQAAQSLLNLAER